MTKVISNQKGVEINSNGNDETILTKNGAEQLTDDLNGIKILNNSEYMGLDNKERENYVQYSPSLQSMAYSEFYALQNQLINGFNSIGPAIEKLDVLQNMSFMTQVVNNLKAIAGPFAAAAETIRSLENVEIIGTLAKPITTIVKAIGSILALVYANMINPYNMFQAYKEAFKNIDMTAYKNLFNSTEESPSIDLMLNKTEVAMNEVNIPDAEIKAKYEEQKKAIKNQLSNIKEMGEAVKAVEDLLQTYDDVQLTLDTASLILTFGSTADIKEAYRKQFEESLKQYKEDYTEQSQDMAKNINDFGKKLPIKWIKKEDLKRLKELEKESNKKVVVTEEEKEANKEPPLTPEEEAEKEDKRQAEEAKNAKNDRISVLYRRYQELRTESTNYDKQIRDLQAEIKDLENELKDGSKTEEEKAEIRRIITSKQNEIKSITSLWDDNRNESTKTANELNDLGEVAW